MGRKSNEQKALEAKIENDRIERRQIITIVIISAFIIVGVGQFGFVGRFLYQLQRYLFGTYFWSILVFIIFFIIINMINRKHGTYESNVLPIALVIAVILMLTTYFTMSDETGMNHFVTLLTNIKSYFGTEANSNVGGGLLGTLLYGIVSLLIGRNGVMLVASVLIIIALLLLVSLDTYKNAFRSIFNFIKTPVDDYDYEDDDNYEVENTTKFSLFTKKKEEKKSMFGKIDADLEDNDDGSDLVVATKLINQNPNSKTREIPVSIPGEVVSSGKSVFINIDELMDDRYSEASYEEDEDDDYVEYVDDEEEIEYVYEDEDDEEEYIDVEEVDYEDDEDVIDEEDDYEEEVTVTPKPKKKKVKAKKDFSHYRTPAEVNATGRLLEKVERTNDNARNEAAAKEKGEALIEILKTFDIDAKLSDTHIGPSVTQFEIKPDANVKVSKIIGLTDNIKMQLAAKDVRIEAPIPGRPTCGVEIPNAVATPVKMKELFNDRKVKDEKHPLLFVVGKDLQGNVVTCRLDKMPHLLIAGATGSGKSVCMNSIITSLLLRTNPDDVKMLLIDPKKVEFTPYHDIPHLIGPVIDDANKASNALKVIVQMMDERYNIFALNGVKGIDSYNEKIKKQNGKPNPDGSPCPPKLPYIVVIIDELADLMSVAGKDVESSIQRITQLARAAGIHLIVATQRPSVNVITGVIKSNIPSRIAFAVSSGIDSRTILDSVGAERLLGNGDMLYMPIGQNSPERVQGVFVTDNEVFDITEDVKKRGGAPIYDDHFIALDNVGDGPGLVSVSDDPMFEEIKEYVIQAQKASTSLLQRRFGIGYNRAARMIDALEENGIIGPAQGSKPREVFVKPD